MPPNVIIIAIDNLRFDLISSYPDKTYLQNFLTTDFVPETPTLDALAAESCWFQQCVSVAGSTPLSFATALTGVYPYRHGVTDFVYSAVRPDTPTLFELFGAAGYRSAWMSREPWLLSLPEITRGAEMLCANEQELFAFARQHADEPLLLFVHFLDCHKPFMWTDYDRPDVNRDFYEEMQVLFGEDLSTISDPRQVALRAEQIAYEGLPEKADPQSHYAKLAALYLKGIAKFDRGRLSDFVQSLQDGGLWQDSYVAVFSDHGEFRDPTALHLTNHGSFTAEELMRVACMLRGPDITPSARGELVGLVDLTPTLADVALSRTRPLQTPAFDGRSLRPLLTGEAAAWDSRWYLHEGWQGLIDQVAPPNRFERAVRTPAGLRYTLRGDVGDLADTDRLGDEELAAWIAGTVYPLRYAWEPERRFLLDEIARAGGGQAAALALLLRGEAEHPRYGITDLREDPFERHPLRVSYTPERWRDYDEKYQWMLAHSGPCWPRKGAAPATEPSPDEQEIAERLRGLGYHD